MSSESNTENLISAEISHFGVQQASTRIEALFSFGIYQ